MREEFREEINSQALNSIRLRMLHLERENAKTSEKSDSKMVESICRFIEEEVDRYTTKEEGAW